MTPDPREEEMTRLGRLGLLPFAIGTAGAWLGGAILPSWIGGDFERLTMLYGGVVAAYVAGIGAGGLLTTGKFSGEGLLAGMVAVLVGLSAMAPNGTFSLPINPAIQSLLLVGVLGYLLLRDLRAVERGDFPRWYGPLRTRLTLWASVALLLVGLRQLMPF